MTDRQFSIPTDYGRAFGDCFGSGNYLIDVGRKVQQFDWSDRFGPLPTRKNGVPVDLEPKHPFWRAVSLWKLQGARLDGKTAIWHEPKRPVLKHLGGKNYLVVENGEEGWDW